VKILENIIEVFKNHKNVVIIIVAALLMEHNIAQGIPFYHNIDVCHLCFRVDRSPSYYTALWRK